ncbi:McrB family protein [Segatella copri]|uniref:McrB family protein n=1 Tax=Segatella copri TaxID=165179 RepID=UPI00294B8B58|nr:AAA family ATPase [Segatella copri]
MAKGLNNFNPKEYIISIETNLDKEGSRRDLRSIYDYANEKINGRKFLKCSRSNYKADINEASFIYIGTPEAPHKEIFENFVDIFDSRPYLNSTTEENIHIEEKNLGANITNPYRPYITAIKSKPFLLLAGISGTGKSRIVRELARACWEEGSEEYNAQKPKNFQMVQVKPNWHDSSDLIGYVSRVSGKAEYVAGDFLRFVAKAWEDEDTPYFLCLDEMNLAPVEQYFAEYLSVVESRKSHEDGTVTTDPILEKVDEEWYFNLTASLTTDEDVRKQFNESGISIPQNLIVVGTVNMDETTFSFSRKVLDRAMTIEMNDVDLHGGLTERNEQIGKLGKAELIGNAVEGVDVYAGNKDVCEKVLTYLDAVNAVLNGTPFKVAYRTRNEFLLYVVNNLPYNKDENETELEPGYVVARALDEITSMKVLSRIEGDDTKVSDEFIDRLRKTIEDGLKAVSGEEQTITSISLAKLKEMKAKLASGYTSFWS